VTENAVVTAEVALSKPADIEVDLGDQALETAAVEGDTVAAVTGEELVGTEAGEKNAC
jgi:hypothetical protein